MPKVNNTILVLTRSMAWILAGALATTIPLVITGVLLVYGLPRNLMVVIVFGVFSICCEHQMSKLLKTTTVENQKRNINWFLGYMAAFMLTTPYTARNLLTMTLGEESQAAQLITFLIMIGVGFYVATKFQDLLNKDQ